MSDTRNESGCRMNGGICACHSGGSYGGCVRERENCCAATLPAAPAPSRATPEQTAEIDSAVKAGRIVFDPGWNDPTPAKRTKLGPFDELVRDLYNFQGGSHFAMRLEKIVADLAARQAPTVAPNGTIVPELRQAKRHLQFIKDAIAKSDDDTLSLLLDDDIAQLENFLIYRQAPNTTTGK